MTEMTEADRKAFEEWVGGVLLKDGDGNYMSTHTAVCFHIYQAALTHARGKQEPVGREWRGLEKGAEPTPWMPHNHVMRSNWEVLVKRKPSKYQIEERPLYAAPPAESEELTRLRAALSDLVSWFDTPPRHGVLYIIDAGETGARAAVAEARAAIAASPAPVVERETPNTSSNAVCGTQPLVKFQDANIFWDAENSEEGYLDPESILDGYGLYQVVRIECALRGPDRYCVAVPSRDGRTYPDTLDFATAEEAETAARERRILSAIEGEGDE